MNADQYIIDTIEPEVGWTARRTFRVWELTALYRTLGLAPREAIAAAVADLRMFPARDYCAPQEVAA